jgi:NAD(P)-dependent dehydrogenase (short-subunit alcohol dehydrogenase family)
MQLGTRRASSRHVRKLLRRLFTGAAAGIVATGAMSLLMLAAKSLGALGEPPPRRLTRRLLSPLGALRPRGRALNAAALAAHFAYGASVGSVFSLLPRRLTTPSGGALFGLGVWGLNYALALPELGLMPPPRRDRLGRPTTMIAAHLAYGATLGAVQRALAPLEGELEGKVVVVCGGSRGLGRALAHELVRQKARVAICGRTRESLEQTRSWLESFGGSVLAEVCDLRHEDQTVSFLGRVSQQLGPIDVLIANAATIEVGPIEVLRPRDFDAAMSEIFGTAMHAALTVLPEMRARGRGTLAFIASIGGRLAVPHLAPYSTAKFAEIGFAEALAAEAAHDGVKVLTVTPGLMRTGSHLHAHFRGDAERELTWFGASAIAPLMSIDADRAAALIVRAIARGDRYLTFTPAARLGAWLHDAAPNLWAQIAAIAAQLLPRPDASEQRFLAREGAEILEGSSPMLRLIAKATVPLALRHGQ